MIGVQIHYRSPEQQYGINEFFELFKTPWEIVVPGQKYDVVLTDDQEAAEYGDVLILLQQSVALGIKPENSGKIGSKYSYITGWLDCKPILQLQFDLFQITYELLNIGLSEEEAEEPYLDLIVSEIRRFVARYCSFVEILAKPWGVPYTVALTHDVDHLSLREHLKGRTFYGRVRYGLRSVLKNYLGKPLGMHDEWRTWGEVGMQLVNSAIAAISVLVPGLKDPWESFDRVIETEDKYGAESSSFYFAQKPGRGIVYKTDSPEYKRITSYVTKCGREVGVHTMDGWDNPAEALLEYTSHASNGAHKEFGTRVHWLYFNADTWKNFAEAGFLYDSTFGFNKTIGFRAGTAQVYRPYAVDIFELPLHIQDGALFRRNYLCLKPKEATERALNTMAKSSQVEALCTLLWHVKSLSTEYTTWADTYCALLAQAQMDGAWMSSGKHIVQWFAQRRQITFNRVKSGLRINSAGNGVKLKRSFHVRRYSPAGIEDFELRGGKTLELGL